jgi:hypothetical protein
VNPKSGLIRSYHVSVEDDNGVYFALIVLAVNPDDAETRVRYILNPDSARVIGVAA